MQQLTFRNPFGIEIPIPDPFDENRTDYTVLVTRKPSRRITAKYAMKYQRKNRQIKRNLPPELYSTFVFCNIEQAFDAAYKKTEEFGVHQDIPDCQCDDCIEYTLITDDCIPQTLKSLDAVRCSHYTKGYTCKDPDCMYVIWKHHSDNKCKMCGCEQ